MKIALMLGALFLTGCDTPSGSSLTDIGADPECDATLSTLPCVSDAQTSFQAEPQPLPPLYLVCQDLAPGGEVTKVCEYVEISRAMQNVLDAYGRYHLAHDAMLDAEAEVNRLAEIARADGYLFGHDEDKCGKNDWSNFNEKWAGTLHDCFRIFSLPLR